MPWNIYDTFRRLQIRGESSIDINAATGYFIALVANTYTPDQNVHDFWDDAVANEVSGTNYTAGGNQIANAIISMNGSGLITWDADDPAAWAQSGTGFSTARRAVIRRDSGGLDSADNLLCYSDAFAADRGNVTGAFSITLAATGIFTNAR